MKVNNSIDYSIFYEMVGEVRKASRLGSRFTAKWGKVQSGAKYNIARLNN